MYLFIILLYPWAGVWVWPSCVFHRVTVKVLAGLHSCLELGVPSQAHMVMGSILLPEAVGLRSLCPC